MRSFLNICFLLPLLCWGEPKKWQNEEEALFLNRIADFWEEEEYQIAKKQIEEFLTIYPDSAFKDTLSSCLGDLFLREKNYASALDCYAKINDTETSSRIFIHKLQCLYHMQWYATLADECEAYLHNRSETGEDDLQITYYLAISLYQQCLFGLNTKDGETTEQIAKRAISHFEKLFQSPIKKEIGPAFAHLLCLVKQWPQAAHVYVDLSQDEKCKEMLFQAASIQAEYDKELALETFTTIASSELEKTLKEEALYNCLILSFDLKKYLEITTSIDAYLESIPFDKINTAHLFFGRSFLLLGEHEKACEHLKKYISDEEAPSPFLREALIALIDASMQGEHLSILNTAISKIDSFYPTDEELLKGKFYKAFLLQKRNKLPEAKELLVELLSLPNVEQEEALSLLVHIESEMNNWASCRNYALLFLEQYPKSDQTAVMQNHLLAASTELSKESVGNKHQLTCDLQYLLASMKNVDWQLLLAKTFFSLEKYDEAIPLLEELSAEDPALDDVDFLLALAYRDGKTDQEKFIFYGEKALEKKTHFFDTGALHASLYNAYLDLSHTDQTLIDKAEEHLFAAFEEKMIIDPQNLLWLANQCIERGDHDKALPLLESIERSEPVQFILGKLYYQTKNFDKSLNLLEEIATKSSLDWKEQSETFFLLGEMYALQGNKEKAKYFFAKNTHEKSLLRTYFGAASSLENARLEIKDWADTPPLKEDPLLEKVLIELKDLALQKNIAHEPLYLESALEYIALQDKCQNSLIKKLALLEKTKQDFERQEDILSQDYHLARKTLEKQNFIYESYMKYIDAEILMTKSKLETDRDNRKELQANAKDLLLKIIEEKAHPALVARASQCLDQ